jgi:hypothetical protein
MYNDEIFDALEDAYNDGYNQAILDTYDDSYIDEEDMYDEATEATALKKAIISILGGPVGELIGNIVHQSRVNKSEVASLANCISEYGDKAGRSAYNSTLDFFIKNGLIVDTNKDRLKIMYKDLTPKGKQFMRGYYSCIDEIKQFDYGRANAASGAANKEAIVTGVATPLNIARKIKELITASNTISKVNSLLASYGVQAAVSGGTSIVGNALIGLIATSFNIADTVKSAKSSKVYKETMRNAKESIEMFDEMYFEDIYDIY